jgi:hypothetical protein
MVDIGIIISRQINFLQILNMLTSISSIDKRRYNYQGGSIHAEN